MIVLDADLQKIEEKIRDFILSSVDHPSINHALLSYFIYWFPSIRFSRNIEVLKSSFTIFLWTQPPQDSKSYQEHLKEATNNTVDELLQQPWAKQYLVERKIFIGGK